MIANVILLIYIKFPNKIRITIIPKEKEIPPLVSFSFMNTS